MLHLLLVSILWGFSFGLIKAEFSSLSAATLAASRLLVALPCFLPFLGKRWRQLDRATGGLIAIGALQYGCMYVALFSSFRSLNGHEIALLTAFTPLYVILANAVLERRWPPLLFWAVASLAVAGALVIFRPSSLPQKAQGIALVQLANLCFAFGQIIYRRWRAANPAARDSDHFAWLYLGGALAALAFALPAAPVQELAQLRTSQWLALFYLGAIASGMGFFLWNAGAVRVSPPVLAVFNNLKIPVAVMIAIVAFGEPAHYPSLIPGCIVLLAALFLAQRARQT